MYSQKSVAPCVAKELSKVCKVYFVAKEKKRHLNIFVGCCACLTDRTTDRGGGGGGGAAGRRPAADGYEMWWLPL